MTKEISPVKNQITKVLIGLSVLLLGADVALIFQAYSVDWLKTRVSYTGVILLLLLLLSILLLLLALVLHLPFRNKNLKIHINTLNKEIISQQEIIDSIKTENKTILEKIKEKDQEIKNLKYLLQQNNNNEPIDDFYDKIR